MRAPTRTVRVGVIAPAGTSGGIVARTMGMTATDGAADHIAVVRAARTTVMPSPKRASFFTLSGRQTPTTS